MAKQPEGTGEAWFDLFPDKEAEETLRIVDELPARIAAFKRMIVWYAAEYVRQSVLSKVPKTEQYSEITDNLNVSEVAGNEPSFAVNVKFKAKKIRKIDTARTVIYIRAKKSASRPPSAIIKVLEDMGPWTVDTLPFWPSKKNAVVVQRKVRKAEVDKIVEMQRRQKTKVAQALNNLGKRPVSKKKDPKIKRGKAVPDIVMIALDLEFGSGDTRAIPAWRTSILELMTQAQNASRDYPQIKSVLTDANDKRWRTWPRVKDKIGRSQVKSYINFMKKIIG